MLPAPPITASSSPVPAASPPCRRSEPPPFPFARAPASTPAAGRSPDRPRPSPRHAPQAPKAARPSALTDKLTASCSAASRQAPSSLSFELALPAFLLRRGDAPLSSQSTSPSSSFVRAAVDPSGMGSRRAPLRQPVVFPHLKISIARSHGSGSSLVCSGAGAHGSLMSSWSSSARIPCNCATISPCCVALLMPPSTFGLLIPRCLTTSSS